MSKSERNRGDHRESREGRLLADALLRPWGGIFEPWKSFLLVAAVAAAASSPTPAPPARRKKRRVHPDQIELPFSA